jgi:hypothetical protein
LGRAYLEATRKALGGLRASRASAELAAGPREPTVQAMIRSAHRSTGEIVRELQAGLDEGRAELAAAMVELAYAERLQRAIEEITELVPRGQSVILVDDGQWGPDVIPDRRVSPFLERDGHYWGRPADDTTAIQELERLRRTAPGFMVFGWPAFWWLEHYAGLHRYLRSEFACVLDNDRVIAFDLRVHDHETRADASRESS